VFDVSGGKDVEGQPIITWSLNKGVQQKWNVIYLDKAKPVPTKGFNKDFGFYIGRPFYLVNRLFHNRVAECASSSSGANANQQRFDYTHRRKTQ